MRDSIDERNLRDKIARSIIKRQRVNYITREELERRQREQEAAQGSAGDEDHSKTEFEKHKERTYNVTTHSESGKYGTDPVQDELTKGQIEKILGEKSEVIKQVMEEQELEIEQAMEEQKLESEQATDGHAGNSELQE